MATWVKTDLVSVGGKNSISGNSAEVVYTYNVYYTDHSALPIDAWNASGIPAAGAQLGSYELFVSEKSADNNPKNRTMWEVKVTYATLKPNEQQVKPDPSAEKWSVQCSVTSIPVATPITKDLAGLPICNTLGEPIECNKVIYDKQLNVTYTTDTPDFVTIDACEGKVNTMAHTLFVGGASWTFSIGDMLFETWSLSESYDSEGNRQCQITLQFLIKRQVRAAGDSHHEFFPNKSFKWLNIDDVVPILDAYGNPVSEAQFIDDGSIPLEVGAEVFLNEFTVKDSADFSTLLADIP